MPLLKRTSSTFVGSKPDATERAPHALSFDEARDLVHAHLASAGLAGARGLHDDGTGGAHLGPTQLYYDYDRLHSSLTCSALVYHFRHHPSLDVVQAFRDIAGELDTGGGEIRYEDDNSGLYLTRTYFDAPSSRGQFKKDMDALLRAAREWSDVAPERAVSHLEHDPTVPLAPPKHLPTAPPLAGSVSSPTDMQSPSVGKQSAARRAHQRSDSETPPLHSTADADRAHHQQENVGGVRRLVSTPVSAASSAAAAASALAVVAETPSPHASPSQQLRPPRQGSPGLYHPRPVQARLPSSGSSPSTVPRVTVVASAADDEAAQAPEAATPSPPKSTSPSGGTRKASVDVSPSHETLFQKLMHKLPHRGHSPKSEETEARSHQSHPHALCKLDPSEPRPSGMPLRIYSSSSPSRAMWEQMPAPHS